MNVSDNWWLATRRVIRDYDEFKVLFKAKYGSESIQRIVGDNISNGKYDGDRSPTAYFLGKVCVVRRLEPQIPEECVATQVAYHFDEGIVRARLCGRIKSIPAMAALLENYKLENYYIRNRLRRDTHSNTPYNHRMFTKTIIITTSTVMTIVITGKSRQPPRVQNPWVTKITTITMEGIINQETETTNKVTTMGFEGTTTTTIRCVSGFKDFFILKIGVLTGYLSALLSN